MEIDIHRSQNFLPSRSLGHHVDLFALRVRETWCRISSRIDIGVRLGGCPGLPLGIDDLNDGFNGMGGADGSLHPIHVPDGLDGRGTLKST